MKTFALLCTILFSSYSLVASPNFRIPEGIKLVFQQQFPDIKNPVFFEDGDNYTVSFKKGDNFSERVYYNADAEIIKTIKYYNESYLDPFICEKVNKKFKGKTIFGVTEVLSNTEHFYQIFLQGYDHWYLINSDTKGCMEIQKRWKGKL